MTIRNFPRCEVGRQSVVNTLMSCTPLRYVDNFTHAQPRPFAPIDIDICMHSSVEIGSSSPFSVVRSVDGQPIIDADEPRHTAAATVYGNCNG